LLKWKLLRNHSKNLTSTTAALVLPLVCGYICSAIQTNQAAQTIFMQVKIINQSPFPLPQYETPGSAGLDLRANLAEQITLGSLERQLIPTGLFIELPIGYEAQVRPRSGLAIKKGLGLVNSPGTIDSDYRGEIKIILVNLSNQPQAVEPGERIAQMVIAKYEQIEWSEVEALSETERGAGGFGSTGI
jgi:dUTP pyrophosphatase